MILQVAKLGPVSRAAGMDCEYPLDLNQASPLFRLRRAISSGLGVGRKIFGIALAFSVK